MGVLNSSRKAMKGFIEKSYSMGQLHGEMKKINDPRRQNLIETVHLTKAEENKIDTLFVSTYGKKIKYDWHRLYQSFTGKFDENYFPEYLFSSVLEPKLNPMDYRYVLDDKLLLPLFCVGVEHVRTPRTYYSVCDGICFDEEKNIVDLKSDNFNGGGVTEAIIKPVQDTSSGVGVEKIKGAESIKNNLQEKAKKKGTYIVQECIAQNEQLAVLYAGAVNTFRVITYLWNGEVFHVPLALRIGQGGSYLDNAHAGGMFIGVNDSGELNDEAFTEFGKRYKEHPDTHTVFKGYKLNFVPELIKTAKKLHLNAPQLGIISWDLTVDQNGVFVLIEANTRGQSIWFPQMANGMGAFGKNTAEILKFIAQK